MYRAISLLIVLYWIASALIGLVFVVLFMPCIWLHVKFQTHHRRGFDIVSPWQKRGRFNQWLIIILSAALYITCLLMIP